MNYQKIIKKTAAYLIITSFAIGLILFIVWGIIKLYYYSEWILHAIGLGFLSALTLLAIVKLLGWAIDQL